MLKTIYICLIFILVLRVSIQAQDLDLMKLNYAELDSLIEIKKVKEAYKLAIPYVQASRQKAKVEFGIEDTLYINYTADLGLFLYYIGHYKEAESLWLEVKHLNAKIRKEDITNLINLATLYQELGDYVQAKKLLEEGKTIAAHLGKESLKYADYLHTLAALYQEMGQYKKAELLFLKANGIRIKIKGKFHLDYTVGINHLGTLYQETGQFIAAEALYLESLEIKAKLLGKEHSNYAVSLYNLAVLYLEMGNYSKAELFHLESKKIIEITQGKEHPNYATSLLGLATLYLGIGDYEKAEPLYLEAKKVRVKLWGKKHLSYVEVLDYLGILYQNSGAYKKSELSYLEGKAIRGEVIGKDNIHYIRSVNHLGVLYLILERLAEAEQLFLEAAMKNKRLLGTENPTYTVALYNLGSLYLRKEKLDKAFFYCKESIATNSAQIDSNCLEIMALDTFDYYSDKCINYSIYKLLEVIKAQYQKTADKTKLKQHYQLAQSAIRLNERFRNDFRDDDDKLRTLEMNNDFVKAGISTALLLDQPTHIQEAFSFAEQNKSILLADAIKGNRARVFGDLPDTLAEEELQLQKKLAELKKENYSVQTADEKARVNRELGELNLKIDSFLKSLKDKYPKYHALKYENITAKAQEIQSLLDEKSLMIEYFQTDTILYLFALSKDQVALYPISIHKDSLEKRIGTLRNALSNFIFNIEKKAVADEHYVENAHWLYQKIVAIALKDKSIKNLIVITDGALGHLPFEAFLTRAVKGEKDYRLMPYLLNDYTISYNYSATLWKDNLKEGKPNSNGEILAFGATYPKVDSNALSFRLPYFLDLRLSLPQLPESEHEVNVLAQNFEGNFLIGEQANEQLFKEKALGYGIIHLAMHGRSNSRIPMLSSLAFTEDNNQEENNFLEAYEISQLELNANLVVLSACETGYGKFKQGEGVISIARSFMYAGAPSLIVSLWQVNDASTAVLMQSFYHYLAAGKTKDAALRQAKLDYIQSAKGDKAHPIFWSAFIQLGNTAPIALETKRSIWRNVLIGFLFLVLFATGIKYWTKKR
ncbi:CHAT domain-containing protein [Aureispira anguillae]|uniref:CHAT domain-containing protein n=1 Tax=Aureispira anguillae TaxID=2864201 RepID=A0A915VMN1_9BACT|nr:CHAT domain-containing tetratricopeptide repeat protein [Aureispira anguillae]BDS09369.1 CHAT domain-containing protein [Aureispira anguillae]